MTQGTVPVNMPLGRSKQTMWHISFWFMLMMLIYWVKACVL